MFLNGKNSLGNFFLLFFVIFFVAKLNIFVLLIVKGFLSESLKLSWQDLNAKGLLIALLSGGVQRKGLTHEFTTNCQWFSMDLSCHFNTLCGLTVPFNLFIYFNLFVFCPALAMIY